MWATKIGKEKGRKPLFFIPKLGLSVKGSQAFKTKDSQARFRFVKFFRVAEMSQSNNKN